MAINRRDHDQRAEYRHYDGSVTTQGTVSTSLRSPSFDKTAGIEFLTEKSWFWRTMTLGTPQNAPRLGFCWIIEQWSLLHFSTLQIRGKVVTFGRAQFLLCAICCKNECAALVQRFGSFCLNALRQLRDCIISHGPPPPPPPSSVWDF